MKLMFKLNKKSLYLIMTFVLLGGLSIYITFIERNLLIVNNHNIIINENGEEKLKVVQFSDTHLGEYYNLDQLEKVVKEINKVNADVVFFTGDLIDNASTYKDIDKVSKVLSKIKCSVGKYAIYGNHDYGGGAVRYYENTMNQSGFIVLKNKWTSVNVNGKKVNICGGDDGLLGDHDENKTIKGIAENDVNLLLIHEPDLIEKYNKCSIDLVLSGHSHGGQVYIPFYGPIKKNTLSEKYNRGLYNLDNNRETKIYVNTGLGNTKVPFRFLNVPEIATFNITI